MENVPTDAAFKAVEELFGSAVVVKELAKGAIVVAHDGRTVDAGSRTLSFMWWIVDKCGHYCYASWFLTSCTWPQERHCISWIA